MPRTIITVPLIKFIKEPGTEPLTTIRNRTVKNVHFNTKNRTELAFFGSVRFGSPVPGSKIPPLEFVQKKCIKFK